MVRFEVEDSEKKKAAIANIANLPFWIGEEIIVKSDDLDYPTYGGSKDYRARIKQIGEKTLVIDILDPAKKNVVFPIDKIARRTEAYYRAGANPIVDDNNSINYVSYSFDSILYATGFEQRNRWYADDANTVPIHEMNWNPYIYDKDGVKQYYQRDFVWSLEDNQLLIESVYQGIDCGRILVRKRSFESVIQMHKQGEKELYFKDIVDGKQRLNAMFKFLRNEYPDMHGNYYNDLSNYAQRKVSDNRLFTFAEMDEKVTDAEVIRQFLKANFTGRIMSKDHIEYVRSLNI